MRPSALLVAGLLLGAACSSRPSPGTTRLPDGTISLTCNAPLAQCLSRAEDVCKNENYEVLRARDQRDTYGPETGSSQVQVRSSEAIIRCTGTGRPLMGRDPLVASAGSAPPPAAAPPPVAVRACVPGTTQACIGPGKCDGGQSCLPDGTAFGPCDCGTLGAPATAPGATAVAPAAPAPAPAAAPAPPPAAAPGAKPAPPPPSTAAPGVVPATPLKK